MSYTPLLHIVLFQPEIPHNTGAIGRTCVAIEAKLWLVRPLGFRMDEKTLRRAGLDYWQHLDWETVDDWNEMTQRLPDAPIWFFSKSATTPYTDVQYAEGDALVFGSETQGLPQSLLDQDRQRALRIPIHSPVRSLNLSNAVAVAAYEALRQINAHGMLPNE